MRLTWRSDHCTQASIYAFISCVTDIVFRHTQSKLLEGINRNVELTREDVKTLVAHLTTHATSPIDDTPSTIPLEPRREDYEDLIWWDPAPWFAIKNKTHPKDTNVNSLPIISLYMED